MGARVRRVERGTEGERRPERCAPTRATASWEDISSHSPSVASIINRSVDLGVDLSELPLFSSFSSVEEGREAKSREAGGSDEGLEGEGSGVEVGKGNGMGGCEERGRKSSFRCVMTGWAVTYGGVLNAAGGGRIGLSFPSR